MKAGQEGRRRAQRELFDAMKFLRRRPFRRRGRATAPPEETVPVCREFYESP